MYRILCMSSTSYILSIVDSTQLRAFNLSKEGRNEKEK